MARWSPGLSWAPFSWGPGPGAGGLGGVMRAWHAIGALGRHAAPNVGPAPYWLPLCSPCFFGGWGLGWCVGGLVVNCIVGASIKCGSVLWLVRGVGSCV